MRKLADISPCGLYRYTLLRVWDERLPLACFIGLNPSTADATLDDNTIRKCMGFARHWRCGGILMLNLYAWRATKPAELKKQFRAGRDIVGLEINSLQNMAAAIRYHNCKYVIAAWGKNGGIRGESCKTFLSGVMPESGKPGLHYLRLNKDGSPEHPLYIPYATKPKPFEL